MKFKLSMALIATIFGVVILTPAILASEPEDAGTRWIGSFQASSNCTTQDKHLPTMNLTITNKTNAKVWIAQLYWCKKEDGFGITELDKWSSSGWWSIEPGQSLSLRALAKSGKFYLYAESGTRHWPWSDYNKEKYPAWVHPKNKFDIVQNLSTTEAQKQGYVRHYFMALGTDNNYRNSCDLTASGTRYGFGCRVR